MKKIAGALSKFANVATEPHGMGIRVCVVLDCDNTGGDYVEFVLHETEAKALLALLKEAFSDES